MLVHKINFKVHGTTFKNENNIDIQDGISKILSEYKKHDYFDSFFGGYTRKEIIDMQLNVSEFEGCLFSGDLKQDTFNNKICYKIFIETYNNSNFHIGYAPKELVSEISEWLNKEDLKYKVTIFVTGGKCKHCVTKEEHYEEIETVEIETLNYGFIIELRFFNDETSEKIVSTSNKPSLLSRLKQKILIQKKK